MLIRVNVNAPDDKITEFGVGAKLYWARDNTSATGPFTSASGSVTLVADQSQYEIIDATGVAGHYYRTRVGNSAATSFDEWSTVFQAGAPTAYASFDDLREYLSLPDASKDNLLADILAAASGYIDAKCGRDFYRHPGVTGTEVRTFDGGLYDVFVKPGLVSVSSVAVATATGGSFGSPLSASEWILGPRDKASDESYHWLSLSDVSTYSYWPVGYGTVQITGVFGSATIPPLVTKATLDLAREWYRQGPGGGGPIGINQFSVPIFASGLPTTVRDTISRYGVGAAVA